jgi:AcrR family transcriptional regulator
MLTKSEYTVVSILGAAEELFVRRAYADVSMRDLAEAAEVTTGALYHHFPSKEKLYYTMLTAYLGRVRQASLEAIPVAGNCRDKLRALTQVFLALPPEQRGLMALVRRDSHVFPDRTRQGIVRAYQATVPDLVEQVVRAGIQRGELKRRDARWLAWTYVAIVETALTGYAEHALGSLDERLDAALDLFLEGAAATAGMSHAD